MTDDALRTLEDSSPFNGRWAEWNEGRISRRRRYRLQSRSGPLNAHRRLARHKEERSNRQEDEEESDADLHSNHDNFFLGMDESLECSERLVRCASTYATDSNVCSRPLTRQEVLYGLM